MRYTLLCSSLLLVALIATRAPANALLIQFENDVFFLICHDGLARVYHFF